jgi:hypothetical protein
MDRCSIKKKNKNIQICPTYNRKIVEKRKIDTAAGLVVFLDTLVTTTSKTHFDDIT